MSNSYHISNDHKCQLRFHKSSLRGVVTDYVIEFKDSKTSLDVIVEKTFDLFNTLCEYYSEAQIKARLIAECEFLRHKLTNETEINETETYHFASYSADWVNKYTAFNFYESHMQKIASRMDEFNKNGSSLKLLGIKHIHVSVTVCVQ